MSVQMTEEQQLAVSSRGRVIVSASAGSGKTFVMIERLVALILGGEDVRHILAVTFTNKAAAQMRERLRTALLKGIAEREGAERERLKEQLAALPLAEISTIHAFCGRLVRSYFYAAGVDPAFRITGTDNAEGMELSTRAMDAAFERAYAEGGVEFSALLDVWFRRRKDAKLKGIVKELHEKMRGLADYRAKLADMGASDFFCEACETLAADIRRRADMVCTGLSDHGEEIEALGEKFTEFALSLEDQLTQIAQAGDLFDMQATAAQLPPLMRRPARRNPTEEVSALIGFLAGAKDLLADVRKDLSALAPREEEKARCQSAAALSRALAKLVIAYDDEYAREKADAGVLDYNDLEHCTLRLLENEQVRADLAQKYTAVFVDEYQDVNPVQEAILTRIAGDEVFLVGDAKQAIYGFRGSRSEFFEEKERFLPVSLRLSSNFRSAPAVLDAANRVFAPLVDGYVPMQGSDRYREHSGEVRLYSLPKEKADRAAPDRVYSVLEHTGEEKPDPLGEKVAALVEGELGKTWFDADKGTEKKVTFGDIAVLTRRRGGEAGLVARALLSRGIPVTTAAEVNICDFFEARLLLDWLSFLDNPEQDIPFATALLSAVGNLTEADLTRVRLSPEGKGKTFRRACASFCTAHPSSPVAKKLTDFEARAAELRVHARIRTAAEVMNELLSLGLEAQIAAKQGGTARLARVRRLIAEGEETDVNGFLSRLKATGYYLGFSESGGENSVKVLTMHASKGLEYPVVILAGTDVRFRGESEQDEVIFTEKFLAAPKAFDVENKFAYTTLVRRASALISLAEERKQERNLLYVGMTRAKYRLHIILRERTGALFPALAMRGSDFFDQSACADLFVQEEQEPRPAPPRRALVYRPDEEMKDEVLRVYEKPYAFEASTRLRVKSSATDLLREQKGEFLQKVKAGLGFLDEDEEFDGDTSKEAGIAYHAFLQHVHYGQDAGEELARMMREGELTPQQAALLKVENLRAILAIPCLAGLGGKRVLREQTFLMRLKACEIKADAPDDEIIFQGAIDLLVIGGGYEVIDYKYSVLSDSALKEKYAVQIDLYKKAVARVAGVREEEVRAKIVNIARCREIDL